jgi:hypothetical protein
MTTTEDAGKASSSTQEVEREANRRRSERVANQRSKEEDLFEQGMLDAVRKFRKEQDAKKPTSS